MINLPPKEIDKLIALHKDITLKKDGDKVKCIIYWGRGYSWEEIKEILFIADGSIKSYVDTYKKYGIKGLLAKKYQGHNFKLTPDQENSLSKYVDTYNVLTSSQACNYVKNKFDVDFTVNGMTRALKRLGFSYKKPKRTTCKTEKIEEKLFAYRYFLKSERLQEDESLLFLDAAGLEHNAKIDYGWMRRGTSKLVKTNTGRKRININAAYDIKGHEVVSI